MAEVRIKTAQCPKSKKPKPPPPRPPRPPAPPPPGLELSARKDSPFLSVLLAPRRFTMRNHIFHIIHNIISTETLFNNEH